MASTSLLLASLVPDFEEAVPGPSGHSHTISCDPQAADSVVMAREYAWGREEKSVCFPRCVRAPDVQKLQPGEARLFPDGD